MKRLLLIGALVASASACVEGNSPIQIKEAVPRDPAVGCDVGAPVLNGRLNFDLSERYNMAFALTSPLSESASGTRLDFFGEEVVFNYEARNPSVSLREETKPIYLVVEQGDTESTVELNLIGDEARARLQPAVPTAPDAMTLIVHFKIRGRLTSGAQVETNEVRFPIVITREGNPCPAGEVPLPGGNSDDLSCFNPGQDNQAFTCGAP